MDLRSTVPLTVIGSGEDAALTVVRSAEQASHSRGWGQPMELLVVYRVAPDDPKIALSRPEQPPYMDRMHPLDLLSRMAQAPLSAISPLLLGFVLICEAEVAFEGGDSTRMRAAFMASLAGRDIHLVRYQGEEVQEQHVCPVHGPDPIAVQLRVVADRAARALAGRVGG